MNFNKPPSYVVIRPDLAGVLVCVRTGFLKRIMYRIAYLCECYVPVALIFTTWITLVYFGAEYLNKH